MYIESFIMNIFVKIFFISFFIDIVRESFTAVISDCKQSVVGKGNLFTHGEFCLRIVSNYRSWYDAQKGCAQRGGDLLQIRESSMQQSLIRELTRLNLKDSKFWIGATDEDLEGQWEWVSGDATMTYSNWNPGQGPNQRGFFGGSMEDCALLDAHDNFQWHDYFCYGGPALHSFICQYRMRTVQTSTEAVQTTEIKGNVVDPNRYTALKDIVAFATSTKIQPTTWTRLFSSNLRLLSSSPSSLSSSSLTFPVQHSILKKILKRRGDTTSTIPNIPTQLFQTSKISKESSTSSNEVPTKQQSPTLTKYQLIHSPSTIVSSSQQRTTQKLVNHANQYQQLHVTWHSLTSYETSAQTRMRAVQTSTEAIPTTKIKGNDVDPNRYTTLRDSSNIVAFVPSTKIQSTTWTKLFSSKLRPSISSSSSSSSSYSLTFPVQHSTFKEKLKPREDRTSTVPNIPTELFQTSKVNKESSTSSNEVPKNQQSPTLTKHQFIHSPSIIVSTSQQRTTQKLVNHANQSQQLTWHSSTSYETITQTSKSIGRTNSTAHNQEHGFLVQNNGDIKSKKGTITAVAVVGGCIVVIIAVGVIVVILRRKSFHKGGDNAAE